MTLTRLEALTLNNAYIRLTGFPSTLSFNQQDAWTLWQKYSDPPWTIADLELVIGFIKRHMGHGKNGLGFNVNSLRFRNLIWDTANFEELLGPARAEAGIKRATARDEILEATGRPPQPPAKPKTAGDVLASARALEEFRAWRQGAGL